MHNTPKWSDVHFALKGWKNIWQNGITGEGVESKMGYREIKVISDNIQQWKHQSKMWNLFKVNKKDASLMSLMFFWSLYYWLWTYFTYFSNIFTVDFEQLNQINQIKINQLNQLSIYQ